MNFKKYKGKIVAVNVLDHERDTSIDPKDACKEKTVDVMVYGKFLGETDEYIIVGSWICEEDNDVYRLLKCAIKNVRILN